MSCGVDPVCTGLRPSKRVRAAAAAALPVSEPLEARRLLAAVARPVYLDAGVPVLAESAPARMDVAAAAPTTDLALDPAFGTGGVADVPYLPDSGTVAVPVVMAAQPDGKVLVGYYSNVGHVRVQRFNADGTLDRTFGNPGNEGTASLPVGGRLRDMFVRPDGRIVFIGDRGRTLVVASMTASGQPDRTFGVTASQTYDLPAARFPYDADAHGALAPDGKIVVVGNNIDYSHFTAVRFNTDGTRDTTFNVSLPIPSLDSVADVDSQPDGKILLAGSNGWMTRQYSAFAVARLLPDGSADPFFGTGGLVRTEVAGPTMYSGAVSLLLLPDGRMLVAGHVGDPLNSDADNPLTFAVYRPDGRLDPSFSNGGVGSFNPGPLRDLLRGPVVRLPDGSIVVLAEVDNFTHSIMFKFTDLRPPGVVGRHVFYNQSVFDGNNAEAGPADDNAIATDKVALLPGQAASFANVTTYTRGINGLMIDVRGVFNPNALADGNAFWTDPAGSPDPSQWTPAPAPASVVLHRGGGPGGSDRLTVIWADGAIRNTWLHVTLRAGPFSGLPVDDVFSFANLVGETGDSPTTLRVNALDVAAVKRLLNTDAAINSRVDFNRDGRVNALDVAAVKQNLGDALSTPMLLTSNDRYVTPLWDEPSAAILD